MRIRQAHVSKSLEGLDFMTKYDLVPMHSRHLPLIIFGMYREEDFQIMENHFGSVTVVWQGGDARDLPKKWLGELKSARHFSNSHWVQNELEAKGIKSELIPISATVDNLDPVPPGDSIYFYASSEKDYDFYGGNYLPEIKQRLGIPIIEGWFGKWNREELLEQYKKCFIGLRLTEYDGCPNTVLELGLLGRRSLFNGHIPSSIPWYDIDSICDSILVEYSRRGKDYIKTSNQIKEYLNINDKFLYDD